jgi:alpha-galactosidase
MVLHMTGYYFGDERDLTEISVNAGRAHLARLLGLDAGITGEDLGPPRARGLFCIDTDRGRVDPDTLEVAEVQASQGEIFVELTATLGLALRTRFVRCDATGIVRRSDTVTNTSAEPITLTRCLSRFVLTPERYEAHAQASQWIRESQDAWHAVPFGTWVLGSEGGRTTQGGTPYLALRVAGEQRGLAFHVLPVGNWVIRVRAPNAAPLALSGAVVELGLADESLHYVLAPGEVLELPEILITPLPEGEPHRAATLLHRYLLRHDFRGAKPSAPIVYNTWLDRYDRLEVSRLERELEAAREVGAEVFMVDAGWFGEEGHWFERVGDWREKKDGAFFGKLREFGERVRAQGLSLGLWIEPERIAPLAPILSEKPEWVVPATKPFFRPRLERPEVEAYVLEEMCRLVTTYELAWLKIDFNAELGEDPEKTELHRYYRAFYRILDALRARFPALFVEGCAGGALRGDLHTMSRVDGMFPTDNAEPVEELRIYESSIQRLLPGRITRWAVVRSLAKAELPSSSSVAVPWGGGWEPATTRNLEFVLRVNLPGMLALSGDLAGLDAEQRAVIARHVELVRAFRETIIASHAELLTPPRSVNDRGGWSVLELLREGETQCLVIAYRLEDPRDSYRVRLRGLDPLSVYRVCDVDRRSEPFFATGAELMASGMTVRAEHAFRASVYVLSVVARSQGRGLGLETEADGRHLAEMPPVCKG